MRLFVDVRAVEREHQQALRCSETSYSAVGVDESRELCRLSVIAEHAVRHVDSKCCCSEAVEAVAAPVDRLFAGSRYGISVWGMYLRRKVRSDRVARLRFAMHQTVGGFGRMSEAFGLPLSASTLVSRNASFLSMFGPLFNAIREHVTERGV